jgi:hypothetical protein
MKTGRFQELFVLVLVACSATMLGASVDSIEVWQPEEDEKIVRSRVIDTWGQAQTADPFAENVYVKITISGPSERNAQTNLSTTSWGKSVEHGSESDIWEAGSYTCQAFLKSGPNTLADSNEVSFEVVNPHMSF